MTSAAIEPVRPASAGGEPMPDDFGPLLRRLRVDAGLSQPRLGRACGLNPTFISRLESGERTPRRDSLAAIITALGISPDQRDRLWWAAGFMPADPLLHKLAGALYGDCEPSVRLTLRARLDALARVVGADR